MKWLEGLMTFGYRHRTITFLIILIFSVLAYKGTEKLTVDTDVENLISKHVDRESFDRVSEYFDTENATAIFIEDKDLFTVAKLKKLQQLVNDLSALKDVEQVNSIFDSTRIVQQGPKLVSEKIILNFPETDAAAQTIQTQLLEQPLLTKSLISTDGNSTAINITLKEYIDSTDENLVIYDEVEDVLRDYQYDFKDIFQMGDPRLTKTQYGSMFRDLSMIGPISVGLLVAILFTFFMTTASFVLPMLTAGVSILWTFGFMGYVGIPLNLLIVMLPTLVIVMGATEDIHMLSAYMEEFEKDSMTPITRGLATRYMIKKVSLPIILTGVTTWFGFAVSQFSDVTMIRQFSQAASFSFLANAVSTILIVPAYLATFGPKPSARKEMSVIFNLPSQFAAYMIKHQSHLVIAVFSVVVGIMAVYAQKVSVNTAPLSFFNPTHPLIQDADAMHKELAGINTFFVTFELNDDTDFKDPENLQFTEDALVTIRGKSEVDLATGLADYISYINEQAHQGDEKYYEVPDERETIDQYLSAFNEGDLDEYVTRDYKVANIVVRHNIKNSEALNQLVDDLRHDLNDLLSDEDITISITGEDLLINNSVSDLIKSQIISMGYLVIAIFLIISILFTSKLAGFLALIPNFVPLVILFGLMGIFQLPLNPGTTLVAVILISIAVDDTIHLFHAYIHECRHEPDNKKAVIKAIMKEFRPIVTTSLALSIGFATLMFSDIKINFSFGLLAAISILLAMLCDIFLTPVLLSSFRIVSLYNMLSIQLFKNVVAKSPLFDDMSAWEIKKAILLCVMDDYKAGDTIINQGETDSEMYMILKGHVDIVRKDDTGVLHHIAELKPGDVFGEVAFVDRVERTASVIAKSNVTLIRFNEYQLSHNMRNQPKIAQKLALNIAKILSKRLRETTAKTFA